MNNDAERKKNVDEIIVEYDLRKFFHSSAEYLKICTADD